MVIGQRLAPALMTPSSIPFDGRDLIQAIRTPERLRDVSLQRWDTLLRVAKRANLIGRLAEGIQQAGIMEGLPAQVRAHLDSARVLTLHQREAIAWESRHISKALESIGGPVVLLKGAAYAITGRAAANGRLFSDVDILVPRDLLNKTEAALMMHGWVSGHHDSYDERYYRKWMHEIPPMTSHARGTVIDVHHNILPLTTRHPPDAKLLLEASVPIPGTIFSSLCPADMVIHSATHLFHETELQNGLRDLFDLDALLTEFSGQSTSFWSELEDRAALLGLAAPLLLALRYSAAILGTAVPEPTQVALEKATALSRISLLALDAIYLRALMPDHPLLGSSSTHLARAAVYLRGHYLRMPLGLLTMHLGRKFFLRLFRNTSRSAP